MIISWFSGGITSAVACKIAQQNYSDVLPVFIETGGHHPDMPRFLADCEKWFGVKIKILQDTRYKDHFDLCEKEKALNTHNGAECTRTLKKRQRHIFTKGLEFEHQVFGFEHSKKEINRALRFQEQNPETKPLFPLITRSLNKNNCLEIIHRQGIEIPKMYKLGYMNNNCVGCVKGGKAYWNKIRKDFPEVFDRMAKLEEKLGRTCISGAPLKDLKPTAGYEPLPHVPECDSFCDIELANIEHKDLKKWM
jgi:3'-phosphoadenosine 5'-phosphosulfate sulfotransferase (PAPS reductase)/FAD synthetase